MSDLESNKAIATRYFEEFWNKDNPAIGNSAPASYIFSIGGYLTISERRSLGWNEKSSHVRPFQFQQFDFFADPSRISGKAAVGTDNPVTGNDDGNGIMPHCAAHRLAGHGLFVHTCSQLLRDLAVCCALPVGNFA